MPTLPLDYFDTSQTLIDLVLVPKGIPQAYVAFKYF